MVARAWGAADITVCFETVDQTHGAVMAEKQALGQAADAGFVRMGKAANGEEHLVLLGFESGGFGGLIASAEELADAVAQFGQGGVFGLANCSFHCIIIS